MVGRRTFRSIYGVDFSGAKLAGRNTWIARLIPTSRGPAPFALDALVNLGASADTDERSAALAHLVGMIAASRRALWALDFPFGLPHELVSVRGGWPAQFSFLHTWQHDDYGVGLECVRRAQALGLGKHVRRLTDSEARAPFDPYHYRIIYQTVHGMWQVLRPLRRHPGTAVLPFQYARLALAERVLVEACPASTLKRLDLPHQNYKQPEGGPLTPKRRRVRHMILAGLVAHVSIHDAHRRVIMRNGGGDALDAVIAAVGAAGGWRAANHRDIAAHPRYRREGRLYV